MALRLICASIFDITMGRNCWLERSVVETAFSLILIVTVPFLLLLTSIYMVALLNNCPNCSIDCEKQCKASTINNRQMLPIPRYAPTVPIFSLQSFAEKYTVCPEPLPRSSEHDVDYSFVVSILQDVYVDNFAEQRYVCAGAIITFAWVVTSGGCVANESSSGVFVRAGSKYWSRGGSVHEIQQVASSDGGDIAAVRLRYELPKLSTIRPVMLSGTSLYRRFGVAEAFGWRSSDRIAPLKLRRKNAAVGAEPVVIFRNRRCQMLAKNRSHVFCATTVKERSNDERCFHFGGFPVIRSWMLVGIEIRHFCSEHAVRKYLIYDFAHALSWIERLTGVYVEYL